MMSNTPLTDLLIAKEAAKIRGDNIVVGYDPGTKDKTVSFKVPENGIYTLNVTLPKKYESDLSKLCFNTSDKETHIMDHLAKAYVTKEELKRLRKKSKKALIDLFEDARVRCAHMEHLKNQAGAENSGSKFKIRELSEESIIKSKEIGGLKYEINQLKNTIKELSKCL